MKSRNCLNSSSVAFTPARDAATEELIPTPAAAGAVMGETAGLAAAGAAGVAPTGVVNQTRPAGDAPAGAGVVVRVGNPPAVPGVAEPKPELAGLAAPAPVAPKPVPAGTRWNRA